LLVLIECVKCGTRFVPAPPGQDPPAPPPFPADNQWNFDPVEHKKPHRGTAVLALGVLSFFTVPLILGPVAWVMGRHDLRRMRAGLMDPAGEGITNAGRICGMVSTLLSVSSLVAGCCVLAIYVGFLGGMGLRVHRASNNPEGFREVFEDAAIRLLKGPLDAARQRRQQLETKLQQTEALKVQLERKLSALPEGSKQREEARKELDQLQQIEGETWASLEQARQNERTLAKELDELETRRRVERKLKEQPAQAEPKPEPVAP
jgi:hypothetical protein